MNKVINKSNFVQIITILTDESEDKLSFPAVTLCNLNKVDCSNLHNHIQHLISSNSSDLFKINILCNIYVLGRCQNVVFLSDTINHGRYSRNNVCVGHPSYLAFAFINGEDPFIVQGFLSSNFEQLPDEDIYAIAPGPQQMIKSCRYESSDHQFCKDLVSGSTKFISPYMGVCYTFNYVPFLNGSRPLQACLIGESYGLELELDIRADNILVRGITPAIGVKVILHSTDHFPLTNTQGITLSPGTHTQIALESIFIQRQKPPYVSKCQSEWNEDYYPPDKSIPYSELLCNSICTDDIFQNLCNCTISYMVEINRKISHPCNIMDPKDNVCVEKILQNRQYYVGQIFKQCQGCRPQCNEQKFKVINIL